MTVSDCHFQVIGVQWQTQVENEHYSTVSGLIRLVISLECFIEITPARFSVSLYE